MMIDLMTPACRGMDTELWFSVVPSDIEYALQVCAVCPLRGACLSEALSRPELHGVWGGVTEQGREAMLRGDRPRHQQEGWRGLPVAA